MPDQENKRTDSTEDLDAALQEKFQEVQAALEFYRTNSQPEHSAALPKAPEESETPEQSEALEEPEALEQTAPDDEAMPQFDIAEQLNAALPADVSEANEEIMPRDNRHQPDSPEAREIRRKKLKKMYRKKHTGNVIRIAAISAVLFGGSVYMLVGTHPTESAEENRMLAQFPSFSWEAVKDGSYTSGITEWFEDTVPGRSFFKKLISRMEIYKGIPSKDAVQFYGNIIPIQMETKPAVTKTVVQTGVPAATPLQTTTVTTAVTIPEPEGDPIEVGDGIVLVNQRAINIYGGSFARGEAYADSLNHFKADLKNDVNVYSLVAPTAVSYYLPDSYAGYTGSEPDNIENINEHLQNVTPVDAYTALIPHVKEEIYARTDHHWLPLGAYYAAEEFAKTAGVPFADLTEYTKTEKQGYVGSMYTFTKSAVLQDNPEDFVYYTPKNNYQTEYYDMDFTNPQEGNLMISLDNVEPVSWYLVFMGGDERIAHVHTDCDNGRTLVIIKDSYGNALVPYLTGSFTDIYVADMRYLECNAVEMMQKVGATDVLFAMNTFSATGGNSEHLETIRTQ